MGHGLRRYQVRDETGACAARSLLPERNRRTGQPNERDPRQVDLGQARVEPSWTQPSGRQRDLYIRLLLPRWGMTSTEGLVDMQNAPPERHMALEAVGVSDVRYPI